MTNSNNEVKDVLMGISTIFLDIKFIEETYSKDQIVDEIEKIMHEKGLNIYSVLTSYEVDE